MDTMFSLRSIMSRESVVFALQYVIITVVHKNIRHNGLDMVI